MAPRSAGPAAPRPAACDGGGAAAVVEEERLTAPRPAPPRPAPPPAIAAVAEAEEEKRRRSGAQTVVSSSRTARTRRRRGGRGGDSGEGTGRRRRHRRSYSAAYAVVRWIVADLALLAAVTDHRLSVLASLAAAQLLASCSLVGSAGRAPTKEKNQQIPSVPLPRPWVLGANQQIPTDSFWQSTDSNRFPLAAKALLCLKTCPQRPWQPWR